MPRDGLVTTGDRSSQNKSTYGYKIRGYSSFNYEDDTENEFLAVVLSVMDALDGGITSVPRIPTAPSSPTRHISTAYFWWGAVSLCRNHAECGANMIYRFEEIGNGSLADGTTILQVVDHACHIEDVEPLSEDPTDDEIAEHKRLVAEQAPFIALAEKHGGKPQKSKQRARTRKTEVTNANHDTQG